MLKILIITPKILYDAEKLCDDLKQNYSVQLVTCNSEKDYPHELLSKDPFDLIITFDLVGFEQTTLMGGISYNLVNSKFVNFLLHENLQNEKYLSKQLSLSMFFYCARDILKRTLSGYSVFEITAGIRGDCGGCYEICGGGSIGGMPFGLETLRYIKMLGLLNSHQHF